MKLDEIPSSYRPFSKLILCSNLLENVQVPFVLSGIIPVLVGQGPAPNVWINLPFVYDPNARPERWKAVVTANQSLHPDVAVTHPTQNQTVILAKGQVIIDVASESNSTGTVRLLDLRPIGLLIFGNEESMSFGTHVFAHNAF